jgi:hypothetical protein
MEWVSHIQHGGRSPEIGEKGLAFAAVGRILLSGNNLVQPGRLCHEGRHQRRVAGIGNGSKTIGVAADTSQYPHRLPELLGKK